MPAFKDLTGTRFGRWTALSLDETNTPLRDRWISRCDCGTIRSVHRTTLRNVQSCGCFRSEKVAEQNRKHGHAGEPLHKTWVAMRRRCRGAGATSYQNYGGRGISVAVEWEDFLVFRDWALSAGYQPGLSIERLDVNGNYCPQNCAWIPRSAQAVNTRRTIRAADGTPLILLARANDVLPSTMNRRVRHGWSPEAAATTPPDTARVRRAYRKEATS